MPHKDPALRREYMREWKRENAARHRLLNKYADAAMHANSRARKYGVRGALTANDVRTCIEGSPCTYCGSDVRLGIDHVVPMNQGGPNVPENITSCCHSCNASKWRTDRPWRWSRRHDACVECGTTERKHSARGLCNRCYLRIGKSAA